MVVTALKIAAFGPQSVKVEQESMDSEMWYRTRQNEDFYVYPAVTNAATLRRGGRGEARRAVPVCGRRQIASPCAPAIDRSARNTR